MAHHSSNRDFPGEELSWLKDVPVISPEEMIKKQMAEINNKAKQHNEAHRGYGATGQFPEGRLTEHDEGELRFGVTHFSGKVILNFGTPVRSLGMTPEQARCVAESLLGYAEKAEDEANG